MPATRSQWRNAEMSCGSEILATTWLRRLKRVWYAQGPAIERFEQDMYNELEATLRNVGIFSVAIDFRVYMIGKSKETSRPILMVCCADLSVAKAAKESLRGSAAMQRNPEFALGSAPHPLEGNTPPLQLAAETDLEGLVTNEVNRESGIEVFASAEFPHVGRRLFVAGHGGTDTHTCSTGGVVIFISERTYQLTAGHVTDYQDSTTFRGPSIPLTSDAYSFDGQSEDEDEDNASSFEQDMHRASMSFHEGSEYDTSEAETHDSDSHTVNGDVFSSTDYTSPTNNPVGSSLPGLDTKLAPEIKRIGRIQLQSKHGNNPQLDYALVEIQLPSRSEGAVNLITVGTDTSSTLHVSKPTAIPREERRVIAVTGSGGVLNGVLIPGTTFSGKPNLGLQKLYIVQLDGVISEGDSGTIVVDQESGSVLGHMVSGCPGTSIAYIVPAIEVFADLTARLNSPISIEPPDDRNYPWDWDNSEPPEATRHDDQISTQPVLALPQLGSPEVRSHSSVTTDSKTGSRCDDPGTSGNDHSSTIMNPRSDCGSRARDAATGPPPGHTTAGSPTDGRAVIMPARTVFEHPRPLLANAQTVVQHEEPAIPSTVSTTPYVPSSRQTSRFDGTFQSLEKVSPLEFDDFTDSDSDEEEALGGDSRCEHDTMKPFMKAVQGDEERFSASQVRVVTAFCENWLKTRKSDTGEPPLVGIIDSRCSNGSQLGKSGGGCPWPQRGALSKNQLREELSKPFPTVSESNRKTGTSDKEIVDAERRLVYVPNLDGDGMIVLADAASTTETPALRTLFYRHLEPNPTMGVTFNSKGILCLYAHLTSFVLRPHKQLCPDPRTKPDGEPLRRSWVMECLQLPTPSPGKRWCLYEVQSSVVVTGINDSIWTVYGVVDNYYNPRSKTSLDRLHRRWKKAKRLALWDPIAQSMLPFEPMSSQKPIIWNGREYFLVALRAICYEMKEHWEDIVTAMEKSDAEQGASQHSQTFEHWNEDMLKYLTKLFIPRLSKVIRIWDTFKQSNAGYFASDFEDLWDSVDKIFFHLKEHLAGLVALEKRISEDHRRMMARHLGITGHSAAVHVEGLTVIALLFAPLSLGASMFNMDPTVLPLPQNLSSFIISVGVMGFIYVSVYLLLVNWHTIVRLAVTNTREWIHDAIGMALPTRTKTWPQPPPGNSNPQDTRATLERTPGDNTRQSPSSSTVRWLLPLPILGRSRARAQRDDPEA